MSNRTPTPTIDMIWSRTNTTHMWHQLWNAHLATQTQTNPQHPATGTDDQQHYQTATTQHLDQPDTWHTETDQNEQTTRHDLQAALQTYNNHAAATTAHHGLTSHDITDTATQLAIHQSLQEIIHQTNRLIRQLAHTTQTTRHHIIVARTHGQPAQLTTYGHRIATIVGPLLSWRYRARHTLNAYPLRPPHGAVGTGADLLRVLGEASTTGLGATGSHSQTPTRVSGPIDHAEPLRDVPGCPKCRTILDAQTARCTHPWHCDNRDVLDRYAEQLHRQIGWPGPGMAVTRQTYHRSYDLPVASLMVELASIAQTWATDRRLEAMLGLGNESRSEGQIGSSAMAHKTNPVLSERICSLAAVTRSHYTAMAELASGGWLEGDVSTSGARREILPALFSNVAAILINWAEADRRWEIDAPAIARDIRSNVVNVSTGAVLQFLIEQGIDRTLAHRAIAQAVSTGSPMGFRRELREQFDLGDAARYRLQGVMNAVLRDPIGNVQQQIEWVLELALRGA